MEKIKYPIGEQDFRSIREENKVYVDKTELIFDLVNYNKHIFLARPRRFGKSLLLSTIKYYFEGRKDLFEGLAITGLEKEWKKYPVLHLVLSRSKSDDPESLKALISEQFRVWENEYGITNDIKDLSIRFSVIIRNACQITGERVVILVDEYDNPLINTLHNEELFEKNRELLKSIYSNLKDMDEYIRFGMLTGVSRFSKTTIFSGLNNLNDITFDDNYASICGFTEAEIRQFLWQGIDNLGKTMDITPDEAMLRLKGNYDGYHFSGNCPDIYNPFGMLLALDKRKISDYWVETATTTFLAKQLIKSNQSFVKIFSNLASEKTLKETDTAFQSPVSLLYQTGYLTIKEYDPAKNRYRLGVPNKEVEEGLFTYLLSFFTGRDNDQAEDIAMEMKSFLISGDIGNFMEYLKEFMTGVNYEIIPEVSEKYFENSLYVMFRVMGLQVDIESRTSFSRSDLIVFTESYIYIFELKLDGSAEGALRQIKEKEYGTPYLHDGRKIIKVGANFSSKTRRLDTWAVEN